MKILKSILLKVLIFFANSHQLPKIYKLFFGVEFGENVRITGKDVQFGSEPYLIRIGNNVTITGGVIFETHDGGAVLFRQEHKGLNFFGKIEIGNNVFIGNRAIIMPGVKIGDNVVIGAGSIVTKNVLSNTVAAGVPAKPIKTIEEYKQKILEKGLMIESKSYETRRVEIIAKLNDKKR